MDRSGYKTDVYTDNVRCELPIHKNTVDQGYRITP